MFRRLLSAALVSAAALLPLTQAAPAAAAAPTNDELVQTWYHDFLGRSYSAAATDTGRLYWVDLLNQGHHPEWVLGSILRSYEYANLEVSSYYNDLLGRAPDPGANYWINQTAYNGMAWEWVAQNILASREYINRVDYSSGVGYVRWLFLDVLGRNATDGEAAWWANRYRTVGSLNMVRELWYTDEGVRYRLNENYSDLLRRDVDFGGVSYWSPLERQSDITVQVKLATTPEYRNGWWTA